MSVWRFEAVRARAGRREVLSGVSLDVSGGLVAVCGPNGAGKTTLLRAGLGLLKPASGRIQIAGRDVAGMTPREVAASAGYLPQERRLAWGVSALTVAALGAPEAGPAEAEARARAALTEVGLGGFEHRGVFEMSGGERARVLLARLFATGARLLVLDEPAAGLDPAAQLLVLELLKARAADGVTTVVTLHDLGLAARYADRVVVLDQGRVAADGPPVEALSGEVLERVFGITGTWLDGPGGAVLAASRIV